MCKGNLLQGYQQKNFHIFTTQFLRKTKMKQEKYFIMPRKQRKEQKE